VCNSCGYQQFSDGPTTCPRCGDSSWYNAKKEAVRKENQKMNKDRCTNLCTMTRRRALCFLLALAFFIAGIVAFFKMEDNEKYYTMGGMFIVGILWIIQGLDIFPCCRKCTAC
jgi:hypothetical protein